MIFLTLYEWKLIRYIEISTESFLIFLIVQVAILSAVVIVYLSNDFNNIEIVEAKDFESVLFQNNCRLIKIIILVTSFIGLFSAYQNWTYLLHKFGSIEAIMIRAHTIYRLRVAGELEGGTPYLSILPYVGIIFSGIFTSFKNKLSFFSVFPLIVIIVSDTASVGRGGIFVGFIMLIISFFLFGNNYYYKKNIIIMKNRKKLYLKITLLMIIILSILSIVSEFRGRFENFKGKTKVFEKYDEIPLLSANEYFYFSSNVGVFSKYFENQNEKTMIGENTLLPIYNLVAKFGFIDKPNFYPKGYNIPHWSNSASYLRDLHADFGILGLFAVPFLLSFFCTYYWFKWVYAGGLKNFIWLTYLFTLLTLSVFNMQTRSSFFLISLIFVHILIFFTTRARLSKFSTITDF